MKKQNQPQPPPLIQEEASLAWDKDYERCRCDRYVVGIYKERWYKVKLHFTFATLVLNRFLNILHNEIDQGAPLHYKLEEKHGIVRIEVFFGEYLLRKFVCAKPDGFVFKRNKNVDEEGVWALEEEGLLKRPEGAHEHSAFAYYIEKTSERLGMTKEAFLDYFTKITAAQYKKFTRTRIISNRQEYLYAYHSSEKKAYNIINKEIKKKRNE